jgi:hypothetical protein
MAFVFGIFFVNFDQLTLFIVNKITKNSKRNVQPVRSKTKNPKLQFNNNKKYTNHIDMAYGPPTRRLAFGEIHIIGYLMSVYCTTGPLAKPYPLPFGIGPEALKGWSAMLFIINHLKYPA